MLLSERHWFLPTNKKICITNIPPLLVYECNELPDEHFVMDVPLWKDVARICGKEFCSVGNFLGELITNLRAYSFSVFGPAVAFLPRVTKTYVKFRSKIMKSAYVLSSATSLVLTNLPRRVLDKVKPGSSVCELSWVDILEPERNKRKLEILSNEQSLFIAHCVGADMISVQNLSKTKSVVFDMTKKKDTSNDNDNDNNDV